MNYDIQKAYNSGITGLLMGGEFLDGCFYREKDILEGDYSAPTLSGSLKIISKQECRTFFSGTKSVFLVKFQNNACLFLTKEEYEAGLIGGNKNNETYFNS